MTSLGERTVWLDCDVLQADGGTRTAAISGVWVALALAMRRLGLPDPVDHVAAVSVGIVDGVCLLDLDYEEDAAAEVDMNVVMTGDGRLVEVQATAERTPFSKEQLAELVELAASGIERDRRAPARGARRLMPAERVRVALASRNPGKLRELRALLPGWEIEAARHHGHRRGGGLDVLRERARESALRPPAVPTPANGRSARIRASRLTVCTGRPESARHATRATKRPTRRISAASWTSSSCWKALHGGRATSASSC